MCTVIPSISTIPGIWLTTLSTTIEVLTSASILRHIKSIFNAGWPLTLGVSHGKMWVSMTQI
jgi:hypothetical protein